MKTNREQKKEDSGVRVKASAKALRKRTALENWVQPSVTRRLPSMKSALHEEEAIAAAAKKTKKRCEVSRGRGNTGGTAQKQTHKVKEEGVQWQQTEAPLKCRWRTAGARGSTGGRSDSARRGWPSSRHIQSSCTEEMCEEIFLDVPVDLAPVSSLRTFYLFPLQTPYTKRISS